MTDSSHDAEATRGGDQRAGSVDDLADKAKESAHDLAEGTGDHPAVRAMARTGYAASGLMHLIIGWVAIGIAVGTPGGAATADQSGAFTEIAALPLGALVLWIMTLGFAGLSLWQLAEAAAGRHGQGASAAGSRIKAVSKAILYAVLASGSLNFARSGAGAGNSRTQSATLTASVLDQPFGRVLIVIVGLVVIGVGGYHIVKGVRRRFLRDLVDHPGALAERAGMIGYAAKGVGLLVTGVLLAEMA